MQEAPISIFTAAFHELRTLTPDPEDTPTPGICIGDGNPTVIREILYERTIRYLME